MRKFGLIGFPLSHSFSPGYFAEKFAAEDILDCSYKAFPLETIDRLPELILNKHLAGFNVTIPYKQQVIPFLSKLDGAATEIGAVNTVKIKQNSLLGYNTDAGGFERTLSEIDSRFLKGSMVLGTGGSSKAVIYTLNKLGIPFINVSRSSKSGDNKLILYSEISADLIKSHPLIINCSPSGMYPEIATFPEIPYFLLNENNFLYDLVYNPQETKFLEFGKNQGAGIMNGLKMLHYQADLAWEIWNS